MKIFEITEAKVEMCPEACCGKPVTECKCGPDCEHCDCHAKNKKVDEGYKSKLRKKAKHAGRRSGRRSNKKLRDEFQDTGIATEKDDLGNLIKTGVKGSYDVVAKAVKDYEELIRNNPNHPKVPQVKAELAKLKPMLAKAQAGMSETITSGGTSASSVANVSNPSITRNVKKPKKNKNGTAKNAQDSNSNLMTGQLIKR
tara:strand:- start:1746 stop:2342 length:597 start_codon:yes stop_codon:yes gene_type:complete